VARRQVDFDVVREIGLGLPDVEDGSSPTGHALKLRGRLLACEARHKSAEPNTLVVRVSRPERDRLIAAQPETYYLTDHYLRHPSVLVRLERIHRKALRELLDTAWRYMMEKT